MEEKKSTRPSTLDSSFGASVNRHSMRISHHEAHTHNNDTHMSRFSSPASSYPGAEPGLVSFACRSSERSSHPPPALLLLRLGFGAAASGLAHKFHPSQEPPSSRHPRQRTSHASNPFAGPCMPVCPPREAVASIGLFHRPPSTPPYTCTPPHTPTKPNGCPLLLRQWWWSRRVR